MRVKKIFEKVENNITKEISEKEYLALANLENTEARITKFPTKEDNALYIVLTVNLDREVGK
jgi:hypothetical protein